jgi:putative FmdB family regulatory protein
VPAYDFRCKECRRGFTLRYATYAERDAATPKCPHCGSLALTNLIHRVSVLTSEDTRLERLADPSRLSGIDEDDPRSMGRLMREMSAESGEDLGSEFNDVVDRLESGESPESIEASTPGLGDDGSSGGLDDFT